MIHYDNKIDLSRIRNELQQIIVEGIGDDLIDIPDDIPIFDLGVSSLMLVEGMRRVYDRFGVLVSIRRVIEGQITIGGLALHIEQELSNQQAQKKRAQTTSQWKVQREIPLARPQRHIGFLSRYSSEASAAFNEALLLRLDGVLHGPALHTAIEEVGNRYEALRTALSLGSNTLGVGEGEPLELVVSPVSHKQLEPRLAEIVVRPFETGKRLFCAELLRLSETEHVLALVGHSLILEHQALTNILNEIAELYRVFSREEDAAPMPPVLQWSDYLAMGNTSEATDSKSSAESYWKEIFASDSPRLELPTDHARPPEKKYLGARVAVALDPNLNQRLQEWAKTEDINPQAVLFAAFTAYLHRLSDQNDLVVGFESDPLYPETGLPAIASTRNMLPVRSDFDLKRSFKDHGRSQADLLARANAHKHLSLAELIQILQLPRDQSRSALFTAAFRSWTQTTLPSFEGLNSAYVLPPSAGARYDIELIAVSSPNGRGQGEGMPGIQLVCDYSVELFESETISCWLHGILALLDSGLADSTKACGELPMMEADERERVLFGWNATDQSFPRERTVLDLIQDRAQDLPDHVAIRFGDSSINYKQLMERVEDIAVALRKPGVKRGDRVGILMRRSLDLIPALLATWRVGALYVPMDVAFPNQRIAYMLEDSKVHTVIVNKDLLNLLDEGQTLNALRIEDVSAHSSLEKISPAQGSDSAYMMYTSGSTGKPKGVEIRHSALLNCLLATKEYLEFSPESSMLALTTFSFDISTNELFMPLMAGGCVEIGEDGLVADGIQMAERLATRKPSHVQATPSSWKSALAAGWQGDKDICLISTGEALSRDLAEQLLERCDALWNLYGPTETTVYSSAYKIESEPGKPMRIGRPLPNTQMYILDKQYQPVPIGAMGDLYIAGDGLAVGYWQRPELTSERFVANPFIRGRRMYYTGDLARCLPNGDIICLGRSDDQVKIHGVRIEPGEVETSLCNIENIRDAVVSSWKDARGDMQLVGHVIAKEGVTLTTSELRAKLRERLPEAMIPPYILFTDSFPKTANGKVYRAGLPSPDGVKRDSVKNIEPTTTATEKALAKAWATLLGIDVQVIGRDSDFMDLGGHSLLMTLLMLEIRKLFDVSFSLREFFGASTLKKLSILIDERRQQKAGKSNGKQSFASTRTAEWARQRMAYLQREAQLPPYIAPTRGMTYKPQTKISSVLLTGATGFLGAYTVAEILNTTDVDLYCLVRPKRGEKSKERIERQMRKYQVWGGDEPWQSAWENRLHVVEGDVTLSRMGLPDAVYETLAREVDAIFHGAAHVNFIYPYEALRATNVLGLHEVIQFAFHARIKPVHHLSTAAIWPMGAQDTYYEKDSIEHTGRLNLGYDEAKWVGERCLLHAAERGLPVTRYRPGEVGGDSVTGHCVTDHFIVACVKGFLQFGAVPAIDIEVDVAPVDYVAKAIVYLALRRNPVGQAFHLTNPYPRPISQAFAYMRGLGYQFEELPFEELRDRLVSSPGFSANALFAYQAALEEMDNLSLQIPIYDTRETLRELEGSGITCPPADAKLFETYMRYLQGIGFIPQPEALVTRT